jgi:hypothetical protein
MKIVGDETTLQASNINHGKSIRKLNVLSIQEEWKMLDQAMCQSSSLSSLNLRFGYFYMKNIFI